jgi:hypothetical protein
MRLQEPFVIWNVVAEEASSRSSPWEMLHEVSVHVNTPLLFLSFWPFPVVRSGLLSLVCGKGGGVLFGTSLCF